MTTRMHGFSLWELMVVVALVVFLVLAGMENLLPLRGDAERASVSAVEGGLASATGLEATRRALQGGMTEIASMDGANPVAWLNAPMSNYTGTLASGDYYTVPEGHWTFDEASGTLFYRVRYEEYFRGSHEKPPGIRFRVTVTRSAAGQINGVALRRLDDVAWSTDGSELARLTGVSE